MLPGNHDHKANLYEIFNKNYLCSFQIDDWEIITIDSVQIGQTSGLLNEVQLKVTSSKNSIISSQIYCCLSASSNSFYGE